MEVKNSMDHEAVVDGQVRQSLCRFAPIWAAAYHQNEFRIALELLSSTKSHLSYMKFKIKLSLYIKR